MRILKNYKPTEFSIWEGRVDDPLDRDSCRWHQLIEFIDLSKDPIKSLPEEEKGFCFLGFSCDEGVRRNIGRIGTSKAPLSIRKEMGNLPCYFDVSTKLFDAGDIFCLNSDLETAQRDLSYAVKKIFSLNLFPIVLGGGHEISLGHYRGIIDSMFEYSKYKEPRIGIINFDAHFDLRPYKTGGSSGSMFLQIADQCKEKKISFSYFCLGIQKSGNTVGLFKLADSLGVKYILAKDIKDSNILDVYDMLSDYMKKYDFLYLTICADVFSSAYAPGVSAPQPFGLHPEVVLKLVKHIVKSGKVLSADIAEVSPRFDEDNRTAKLAAIVVFAIINTIVDPYEKAKADIV